MQHVISNEDPFFFNVFFRAVRSALGDGDEQILLEYQLRGKCNHGAYLCVFRHPDGFNSSHHGRSIGFSACSATSLVRATHTHTHSDLQYKSFKSGNVCFYSPQ